MSRNLNTFYRDNAFAAKVTCTVAVLLVLAGFMSPPPSPKPVLPVATKPCLELSE